jgi:CheY-like chemotaxis protein
LASILLVDDDDDFRTMLSEVLERAGHKIAQASDGQQAIDLYSKHATDLVITDLVMPGREGIELIVDLKRLQPDVKIIAISGVGRSALPHFLRMATFLGAQRAVAKPFTVREILDAVTEVLEK